MFIPFVALMLVASVPLLGGRLSALASVRLHSGSLIAVALTVQVLITTVVPDGPRAVLIALHLLTYVFAGVVLWRNRRLPGLLVLAAGATCNGVTIALNHGTLPASARALARAGEVQNPADFANSGVLPHPVLAPLGDILATPSWLPFRNVISIGDMLILLGTAMLLHSVCSSWLSPTRWRRPASTDSLGQGGEVDPPAVPTPRESSERAAERPVPSPTGPGSSGDQRPTPPADRPTRR